MIFVDSTVIIDYFNGIDNWQVDKLDFILGREVVVIGDFILTEVLQGFKSDNDYQKAKLILNEFPILNILGEEMAIKSADNFRFLRKNGITIRKTIDVIIATFCIENNLELLHNDRDFEPFVELLNLKTVNK
ncbi:MAG: VapC toxin family PIN domain ribonuclease [Ignavibacteriales bacterium CG18_big_fil_WC_8_21_14_2_50_31_20]|nr:MAG: VapC toxin family PIN domain ribonuclease [Ignavibacteriales bacterium CG18_big_fil_WC_8_21_14_2_50_31_20]